MQIYLFQTLWWQKAISALSWSLVHSLWQGLIFAAIAAITLLFTKRSRSVYRYTIILSLLILLVLSCCYTFFREWNNFSINAFSSFYSSAGVEAGLLVMAQQMIHTFSTVISGYAAELTLVWFIIVNLRFLRLGASLLYHQRIKTQKVKTPDAYWLQRMKYLCDSLGITQKITLLESGIIRIPAVTGHFKPVIFFPLGMLANLAPAEAEAALLHELAHIRRNDYLVNFLQNITEALFFFNPGLLWLSAVLRRERENCCDDIAISAMQNKKDLISALIAFKEFSLYGSRYATAFPGQKNQLLQRVTRIATGKNVSLFPIEKIFLISGILLLWGILATSTGNNYRQPKNFRKTILEISKNIGPSQNENRNVTFRKNIFVETCEKQDPVEIEQQADVQQEIEEALPVERPDINDNAMTLENNNIHDDYLQEISASQAEEMQNQKREAEQDREDAERDKYESAIDIQNEGIEEALILKDRMIAIKEKQMAEQDILRGTKSALQINIGAGNAIIKNGAYKLKVIKAIKTIAL